MKVGDLVRCNVTRADNTLGVVVAIEKAHPAALTDAVHVLTGKQVFHWSTQRLEVISEGR